MGSGAKRVTSVVIFALYAFHLMRFLAKNAIIHVPWGKLKIFTIEPGQIDCTCSNAHPPLYGLRPEVWCRWHGKSLKLWVLTWNVTDDMVQNHFIQMAGGRSVKKLRNFLHWHCFHCPAMEVPLLQGCVVIEDLVFCDRCKMSLRWVVILAKKNQLITTKFAIAALYFVWKKIPNC